MARRIAIIDGHPDPRGGHFLQALADAYARGAEEGGHELRRLRVALLQFPLLRTQDAFEHDAPPPPIREAQAMIAWAQHLVLLYPLWHGDVPALLKGFIEQTFRPGFAMAYPEESDRWPKELLKGKSARIVVTMGMPGFVYRWYFGAHSLRSLKRNVLGLAGIAPVRASIIGMVEGAPAAHERWLARMRALGRRAQ